MQAAAHLLPTLVVLGELAQLLAVATVVLVEAMQLVAWTDQPHRLLDHQLSTVVVVVVQQTTVALLLVVLAVEELAVVAHLLLRTRPLAEQTLVAEAEVMTSAQVLLVDLV
jgi:hypothetical protein